jgi:hypothetical protein
MDNIINPRIEEYMRGLQARYDEPVLLEMEREGAERNFPIVGDCRPRGMHHAGLLVHCHQWHESGPLTLQELKATVATFANAKDMLVLRDGLTDWKPVRDLPELRFQAAPPPPLPPAPSLQLDAMRSRSSALSDIRPDGHIAAIEEKAKKSMAPPITAANVIGAKIPCI